MVTPYPVSQRWGSPMKKRVLYSGSVHDQDEKDAVMAVLDGGVTSFAIGENVAGDGAQRRRAVRQGVGRDGELRLVGAVPGGRVVEPPCGLRGDHLDAARSRPTSRRSCAPVWCRCSSTSRPTRSTPTSPRSKSSSRRKTRAILLPNLIGNAPDWDAVRAIADRHDLLVVEDSCDALGAHAAGHSDRHSLRHQPHQLRQLAHHHVRGQRRHGRCSTTRTCATAACCCAGGAVGPRCSSTARARASATSGKRSTASATTTCSSSTSSAGTSSRRRWARRSGCSNSRSCRVNYERRQRNFALYSEFFAKHVDRIVLPRQTAELDTAWLCYPIIVRPDAGFTRSDIQHVPRAARGRHPHGVDGQRGAPADDEERHLPRARPTACPTPIS